MAYLGIIQFVQEKSKAEQWRTISATIFPPILRLNVGFEDEKLRGSIVPYSILLEFVQLELVFPLSSKKMKE